jgi:hypothetical protein
MWSLLILLSCSDDGTADHSAVGSDSAATDSGIATAVNTAPSCAVTGPEDGSFDVIGTSITFLGTAADDDQEASSLSVLWSSDKDGSLGTAPPTSAGDVVLATAELSAATHVITLSVTDDEGAGCSDYLLYTVGKPPVATISGPSDGSITNEGDEVSFTAHGSDDTTDALALLVTWASDLDGELDTDGADSSGAIGFVTASLSIGRHTVTLQVADGDGLYAVDTLDLTVNGLPSAPTLSLTPSDPDTTDDLVVTIESESVDPEDDTVSYDYRWSLFGVESAASTDARLPSDATTRGDTWTVTVTPRDSRAAGTAVDASATVGNAAPSATGATIAPNPATAEDTLTCSWTFVDPDDDSDQSAVGWTLNGAPVGSGATLATTLVRGDWVECTITPDDGSATGSASSASLTVSNSAPTLGSVTIFPADATVADELVCSWSGYSDADGDSDASTLLWTINGASSGTSTSLTGGYVRGDTVVCAVTPSDGTNTGTTVSDTQTIANSAPVLASVAITPGDPDAGNTLTCELGTTTDPDGATAFSYAYDWTVNGASGVASSSTLAGSFSRGDDVACSVTPSDESDSGESVTADSVTIGNGLPEVTEIQVSPTSPNTEDTLSVSVSTEDVDGDTVSLSYTWFVDDAEVTGWSDATLDGASAFDKGQTVVVVVVPNDGTGDGASSTSDTITVANAGPGAPEIEVQPEEPQAGADDLVCIVLGDSTDIDGDAVTYSAAWAVDEVLWTGTTGTTTWPGDTIDASATGRNEVWACTMTPNDGEDDGDTATAQVTVATGTCSELIASVDSPTLIHTYGTTEGSWFADPLETLGTGLVWAISDYSASSISEYSSITEFQNGNATSTDSLPFGSDGTGAIAYDGYLYYIRDSTNELVKMDLAFHAAVATTTLWDAGYHNLCPWQWGGYSDIDFEADENGLWVVYGDYADSCNLTVARIDEDLNILATYPTNAGDKTGYGNAWMVEGVLYVIADYSSGSTTISYAFDTCDSTDWDPGIDFYNDYGYNSSITYNPNDQMLYSWDAGRQVQYTVNF